MKFTTCTLLPLPHNISYIKYKFWSGMLSWNFKLTVQTKSNLFRYIIYLVLSAMMTIQYNTICASWAHAPVCRVHTSMGVQLAQARLNEQKWNSFNSHNTFNLYVRLNCHQWNHKTAVVFAVVIGADAACASCHRLRLFNLSWVY